MAQFYPDQTVSLGTSGAALGTAIAPGIGTAIGGGIGTVLGAGLDAYRYFTTPDQNAMDAEYETAIADALERRFGAMRRQQGADLTRRGLIGSTIAPRVIGQSFDSERRALANAIAERALQRENMANQLNQQAWQARSQMFTNTAETWGHILSETNPTPPQVDETRPRPGVTTIDPQGSRNPSNWRRSGTVQWDPDILTPPPAPNPQLRRPYFDPALRGNATNPAVPRGPR